MGSGNLLAEGYLSIDMVIEGMKGSTGMPMSADDSHGSMGMIHDLRLHDCYRCLQLGAP